MTVSTTFTSATTSTSSSLDDRHHESNNHHRHSYYKEETSSAAHIQKAHNHKTPNIIDDKNLSYHHEQFKLFKQRAESDKKTRRRRQNNESSRRSRERKRLELESLQKAHVSNQLRISELEGIVSHLSSELRKHGAIEAALATAPPVTTKSIVNPMMPASSSNHSHGHSHGHREHQSTGHREHQSHSHSHSHHHRPSSASYQPHSSHPPADRPGWFGAPF